jgi:hypothetical protein
VSCSKSVCAGRDFFFLEKLKLLPCLIVHELLRSLHMSTLMFKNDIVTLLHSSRERVSSHWMSKRCVFEFCTRKRVFVLLILWELT